MAEQVSSPGRVHSGLIGPGDKILDEFEEGSFLPGLGSRVGMDGWCDGHRADNLPITKLGKLVIAVQTWDLDRVAGMDVRRRQAQRSLLRHPEVGDHRFVVPPPFIVE